MISIGLFGKFKAPKATIGVFLDQQYISLRQPMTGKCIVSSSEAFDVDEIRIELWVTEWTRATEKKQSGQQTITVTAQQNTPLHQGKSTIAGRMSLTEGFTQDFPFTIHLPSGLPPTYQSQNARNTWMMKGVIAVKGRPDVTSHDIEIQVTY